MRVVPLIVVFFCDCVCCRRYDVRKIKGGNCSKYEVNKIYAEVMYTERPVLVSV